jgi:hypothetical protein
MGSFLKKVTLQLSVLFLVSNFLHTPVFAQSTHLLQLSEKFNTEFQTENARAIRWADSLGLPVRQEFENGRITELMRLKDGVPMYNTTFNADGATVIKSDKVYTGGGAGLNLSGSGRVLGIWDGGAVRASHNELNGRITQTDGATSISDHATHVAGTMIASGAVTAAKGMSFGASLSAHDWDFDEAEMTTAAGLGLKVSQHSYGYITGWAYGNWSGSNAWHWFGNTNISQTEDYYWGFYSSQAVNWDVISNNAPEYLIVKSAGNDRGEGPASGTSHKVMNPNNAWAWETSTTVRDKDGGTIGYDCISHAGTAKNIMTVGAVTSAGVMSSFSGWGPTDDGRIKPDIVAKGVSVYSSVGTNNSAYATYGGTSMSGPMVAGSVGLLLQHQENLHPGIALLSSTMKALILHTADNLGNAGPDYQFGWGMMNTEAAALLMKKNKDFGNNFNIRQKSLTNGNTETITVFSDGTPLKATIVWNDPVGTTPTHSLNPTTLMLVNDLDMRISDASKTIYTPYILDPSNPSLAATNGDNFRDNVEQILISAPVAGEPYTITISHKGSLSGGAQTYSLILSGIYPTAVWNGVTSTDPTVVSNWNYGTPETYTNLIVPSPTGFSPVISGVFQCNNLKIEAGASIVVAPGGQLTIGGTLLNENGVNGIQIHSDASGTGSLMHSNEIQGTIQRYIEGSLNPTTTRYHLVSVPLKQSSNPVSGLFVGSYLYRFDANTSNWVGFGQATNTALDVGQGYMIWYTGNNTTYEFEGTLQNGTFTAAVNSTAADRFSLIPNPYPSAINWNATGWTKTNLYNSIWIWNRSANNYASYINGSGTNGGSNIIAGGQSFFVKSNAVTAALTMNDDVRLHSSQAFMKDGNASPVVRIKVEMPTGSDETIIRFSDFANEGFDPDMDAEKLIGGATAPQLYSILEDQRILSINTLNETFSSQTIEIGFELSHDSQVSFDFELSKDAARGRSVYFEDLVENTIIDLRAENVYSFSHLSANENNRFRVHFMGVTAVDDNVLSADYNIWNINERIYISIPEATDQKSNIEFFDLLGNKLEEHHLHLNNPTVFQSSHSGIVIVRVTAGKRVYSEKVFIR